MWGKKSVKIVLMEECSGCHMQIEADRAFRVARMAAAFCCQCYLARDSRGALRDPRAADRSASLVQGYSPAREGRARTRVAL
jgi:hypothetical protein